MKKLFIGIDVSKDVFDFCLINQDHHVVSSKNVLPNTIEGISNFFKYLKGFSDWPIWICLEHTGRYGALLCSEFSKMDLKYSLINPLEIKYSIGLARGKNDAIDAYRIASYAVINQHKLKPFELPTNELQKLKAIMSVRDGLVKIMVQLKNSLKSIELLDQSLDMKEQIVELKQLIQHQEKAIQKTEKQMLDIINENEKLAVTYTKINKVIGVGPITAIKCISETENFTKFTSARSFNCHCGLAPFEYRSGSSVKGRTKTSKISNRDLKSILYKAAGSAIQHDPQLKAYFNRKISEGKHKLSTLNVVANKLVLRIFAVAKRNEPFVKFYM
jgi:transposase